MIIGNRLLVSLALQGRNSPTIGVVVTIVAHIVV